MKVVKRGMIKLVGLLAFGLAFSAYGISEKMTAEISERIQPAGKVCLEGDDSCGSAVAAASASSGPMAPEDIYNKNCTACHSTGAAGAPKLGDVAAWSGRIDQGMETLYTHAIKGLNAMPAMGLCMSCSEDEIKATVDYIVDASK